MRHLTPAKGFFEHDAVRKAGGRIGGLFEEGCGFVEVPRLEGDFSKLQQRDACQRMVEVAVDQERSIQSRCCTGGFTCGAERQAKLHVDPCAGQ